MEDDQFKRLIQFTILDDPGESFTDGVMKMVEVQEALLADPGVGFSDTVMAGIQRKPVAPVLTKRFALMMLGGGCGVAVLALALSRSGPGHSHYNSYFPIARGVWGFVSIAGTVLSYSIPIILLLLIDRLLRARGRVIF